jgi:Rrf2 family protein
MQFTKAEEYGIIGMIHLARQPRGAVVSLGEISRAEDIPDKFLAKIFQNLTKAGIVKSHRGVRGGFSLAKTPRKITMGEIISSVQGDADPMKCFFEHVVCWRIDNCPIRRVVLEARKKMFAVYNRHSLKELTDGFPQR